MRILYFTRTYCSIALALKLWESELSWWSGVRSGHYFVTCIKAHVKMYEQVWIARRCIALYIFAVFAHSHTFENKSSLAAYPVAGFAWVVPAEGVTGAALLHPPKSSSAATFGAEPPVLNPPPPPGTMLWFASDPPDPQPKAPELVCGGATLLIGGGLVFAELHASFDPHASLFAHPLICTWGGD